jgi:hypothetical protein
MESNNGKYELKRTCIFASFKELSHGAAIMCSEKHGNKRYQDYKELKDVPPEDICVGSGRMMENHPLEWFYPRWQDMEECSYCKKSLD